MSVAQTAGADLVYVCDLQESVAQNTAQELGCDWTTCYDDMVNRGAILRSLVFTHLVVHTLILLVKQLAVGNMFFLTKPMDISLEKCNQLIESAKKANLVLAIDFVCRYRKIDHQVHQAITTGLIGKVVLADLRMKWYRSESYYQGGWPPGWRSRSRTEGGSATNQGVHSIDQLQWFVGPVKTVKFGTFNHQIETEDCAVGILTFESGAFGVIQTTTCSYPNLGTTLQINGTNGTITMGKSGDVDLQIKGEETTSINQVSIEKEIP